MTNPFDLIIIGAGPGGYEAALAASEYGLKTLLIEKDKVGGVCLHKGCIPAKTLLNTAHKYWQIVKKSSALNINIEAASVDFPKLVDRKNRVSLRLQKGIEKMLAEANVTLLQGEATLLPNKEVVVANQHYRATNIILATGSTPRNLPGIEADGLHILNSDQMLDNKELPAELTIIGAGIIGLEFADIYSCLGCKVTLIDIIDDLLPGEDRDAVGIIRKQLEQRGCKFKLGIAISSVANSTVTLTDGTIITATKILLATGRRIVSTYIQDPAIKIGTKGEVCTDEQLQTTTPGVWAIGDINNRALYAHAATYQGLMVVKALAGQPCSIKLNTMPGILFTSPQLATVGQKSELCLTTQATMLGKAHTENNTDGLLKIYYNQHQTIIGVTIVSEYSESLIGEAIILVNKKITINELQGYVHPHPSWSELYSEKIKNVSTL